MKTIIYFLLFCFSLSSIAKNTEDFNKANALYKEGKYNDAITVYNSILKTNHHSAELYFNLGNAHYKLNRIAQSIYNYEKALVLNPNDKDVKQNLAFANNMKIDQIDRLPEIGYTKYLNKFFRKFKTDTWAILTVISFFLFSILLISYYFTYSTKVKRIFFSSSFVFLLLTIFTLTLSYYKSNNEKKIKSAIVFSEKSSVKTEPNLRSQEAFTLHEGTKVYVLETDKDWFKIKLSNGKKGWILSKNIKLLNVF